MSQPSLSRVNIKDTYCIALIALANGLKHSGAFVDLRFIQMSKNRKKYRRRAHHPVWLTTRE